MSSMYNNNLRYVVGVLLSSRRQAPRPDEIVIFVVPWHCSLSTVYILKPEETESPDLGSGFYKSNLVGNRYYDYPSCLREHHLLYIYIYMYILCTRSKRRFIATDIWHNIALSPTPSSRALFDSSRRRM